jgi:pyridoxal phosphate enzyme (YggS family)
MTISDNAEDIRRRIAEAARRAGRQPDEVTLMAVTKTHPPERIREAYAAGIRVFGENKVQEFDGKASAVANMENAEWHMIGHLQTNKAFRAAELFSALDSVDSIRLAEKLNAAASKLDKKIEVLIELNVGGESAKSGVAPDSAELETILTNASRLQNLRFRGLMTVPPFTEDPEQARPFFRRLRELRDQIAARHLPGVEMRALSMGMSHDFEVAIEEGSTCVRVGTAIFGERERT